MRSLLPMDIGENQNSGGYMGKQISLIYLNCNLEKTTIFINI